VRRAARQQFFEVELQPDAEHQQDDPNLSQLFRQHPVGHEARRVGTDGNPAQQIPDDRRQSEPVRQVAERQRGSETTREVRIRSR